MEKIQVAAAVIRRGESVLLCQRPRAKRHGGLWEFPGGKLHAGESMAEALRRELREELGVEVTAAGESPLHVGHDPGSPFEIHFTAVEIAGEPVALEHEQVAWVPVAACHAYALAPSDREFVRRFLI
jgi:mutator protein MutT